MSYLEDILRSINAGRAGLTGGAAAPAPAGAQAPAVADPNAPVVVSSSQQEATHSLSAEDRLAKALKTLRQNGEGHSWDALEKFGGKVIGYGRHEDSDPGHTGRFAVVQRGGKLFHVYRDGTRMKIQEGSVARALGIKEPRGGLAVVPNGAHGVGNGTGGVEAPAGGAGAGSALPGLDALTGGAQAPTAGGGLDAGTGGAVAPRDLEQRLAMLLRLRA